MLNPNQDDNNNKNQQEGDDQNKPKGPKFNYYWIYGLIAVVLLGMQFLYTSQTGSKEIDWREFEQDMLKAHDVEKLAVINENYVEVYIKEDKLENEKYKDVAETTFGGKNKGPHYYFTIGSVEYFQNQLEEAQKGFDSNEKVSLKFEKRQNWFSDILRWLLPLALIIGVWIFVMRRISGGGGGPGGQIFNIGKSKATLFDKDAKVKVTFADVAGLDEAKEEVMEVVDFLKNPKRYTSLGGKIPKGVLLVGAPGTGKTLLAKAVAGEAQVPFFSISGSEFVEMFVGVGASRVRDLFKQAKEKAPCIIFLDEIDAIGRKRGKGMMQSNDERENTLNQLLVEMDGFATDAGVILLAATNRPDVLDQALLRPGRFDRQISIDKPDIKGREQIFNVHLKPLKLAKDVEVRHLAEQTPGFAGAEIANVCNEAALIAARRKNEEINSQDFNDAIDRVIGGLEKKNKIISPQEKKIVAYHEAGHAICGWYLKHADPLVKVSIVPRGEAALGYAQYLPKEQYLFTRNQLIDNICMALGGRAAEDIVFKNVSTGAQNDLERVTKIAYSMVAIYGMNDKLGNISYNEQREEYSFKKPYSDETAKLIDDEVKKLVDEAYERTINLLKEKNEELEKIAQELLSKEIIYQSDFEKLIGPSPYHDMHKRNEQATSGTTGQSRNGEQQDEEKAAKEQGDGKTEDAEEQPQQHSADDTQSENGTSSSSSSESEQQTEEEKKNQ